MRRLSLLFIVLVFAGTAMGQNMLTNPGFEDGLNTWTYGAWGDATANFSTSTSDKQEGTKAAKIDVITANPNDAGQVYLRKQSLQIEKDNLYKLDFHLMSNSGGAESIVVSMYSHSNMGSASWGGAYKNNDVSFQGDGQWHKISLDIIPTIVEGTPDFNALALMFGFAKNTGTYYIDSVSLVSEKGIAGNNYYVSKDGDDGNNGAFETPFLTISKAAAAAGAGDTVFIREGNYEETLSPTNSGLPGFPVVFTSYPGEKVVISAMQALNNWQADEGSIYKTSVDWSLGQENFVMHETTALDLARWPNNTDGDVFTPNSKRNTGGSNGDVIINAYLTHSEIPNYNWGNGGSIWFYGDRPGSGWTAWKAFIKNSSTGKVVFDLDKNPDWIRTYHSPGDKGDYFLEGVREALDYENEWYLDETTQTLYVQLPGGASPEDGKVQMRKRRLCVDLNGKSNIEIRNLAIFGGSVEIGGATNKLYGISSLYGNYTRGVTTGFRANSQSIYVKSGAGNTIEKCEIGFGSGSGIWDQGTGTRILDCYIHDFNFLGFYDAPVNARGESTIVQNNIITRGGRDALQIPAKNSTVAYNDISYSNLLADDCGLLYTLGADKNMKIHHNWFHDAQGRGSLYKAAGIYLDNDAGDVEVHHNVVWNTEWTNIQINWNGTNLDIFNNTLWNGKEVMGAWHMEGTAFSNVRVWNNLSDDSNWEEQADKKNNLTVAVNPFTNSNEGDFTLKANSQPIDAGRVIENITDGYKGSAPDVGAYEFGGDNWVPGITWDKQLGPTGNGCYGLPGENCSGVPTSVSGFSKSELRVYPNPVTGSELQVQIASDSKETSWQLYAINGALMVNGKEQFNSEFSINVASLKTGIYLLRVNSDKESLTTKIIKN
ncbi:T9SS type A sorting domain-containing protein [uncultured Draconibacterium sp.]|uniref:T9SS type A sorting domain-containing protein n=1 Tax=uncultured Draconibacterium sp. TaxID=1573823 RepID=UPI0032612F94